MNENFAAIILGGRRHVKNTTVAELLAIPECREVVMVTRKEIAARARVRNVVLDTGAADFAARSASLAREVLSQGPASAVSCVGVGAGSARWSEEELQRLEVGVVGAFARLAIFRPGIIVGNAHTPAWAGWLGKLVPGPYGNIDQQILGRSIAGEIALHNRDAGEVIRENAAMKKIAAHLPRVTA